MGDIINVYKILIGNPEGKIVPGRRKHTWENNVKIDLKQDTKVVDWIKPAHGKARYCETV
jgi:hypothetical protein